MLTRYSVESHLSYFMLGPGSFWISSRMSTVLYSFLRLGVIQSSSCHPFLIHITSLLKFAFLVDDLKNCFRRMSSFPHIWMCIYYSISHRILCNRPVLSQVDGIYKKGRQMSWKGGGDRTYIYI
jgi:hypothetical protein